MPQSRDESPSNAASPETAGLDELSAAAERRKPENALPQFITPLASLEQQVGGHVIHALQHPGTIAVLSTVVAGIDGGQQIVSIGLDADRFVQVQELLSASMEDQKRRVKCMGFHCQFVDDDRDVDDDETPV
jgi:hypothetical protein